MFKLLGIVVGLYTLYAVAKGEVFAKSGPSRRTVSRGDSPEYFWTVIVIYAGLAVALVTVF
ncbi:MAG: hypothetical protein M3Y70_04275 [Pseudomonadota bacterium]|nr:hypothetical protein [Pseudomonadota bacterium]